MTFLLVKSCFHIFLVLFLYVDIEMEEKRGIKRGVYVSSRMLNERNGTRHVCDIGMYHRNGGIAIGVVMVVGFVSREKL